MLRNDFRPALRRQLGLSAVAAIVVGDMLGSGIFFTPGELAAVAVRLGALGLELSTFPSEELFAGNGGAHCMTCPLLVR